MKVELLADKTTEQITELWKAYQDWGDEFFEWEFFYSVSDSDWASRLVIKILKL